METSILLSQQLVEQQDRQQGLRRIQHHQWKDLINIHKILLSTAAEHIFIWRPPGKNYKIDHILGHKPKPDKCKRNEIMQSLFSDQNGITLEFNMTNIRRKKSLKTWRLKNILLNTPWVREEISEERVKTLSGTFNRKMDTQIMVYLQNRILLSNKK